MSDSEVLSQAIEASGMSARRFAVRVLIRDERTVRRWLAGDKMPKAVRDFLATYLEDVARRPVGRPPKESR